MKKRQIVSFLLALILAVTASGLLPAYAASPATSISVEAKAALLLEYESGKVLYEQNAQARVYPASITKVMTALLVIEAVERGQLDLAQEVTATEEDLNSLPEPGSSADIRAGELLTVEQLLYCLLIPSANEASVILARVVSGSEAAFVAQMNERAAALGCTDTQFTNPHGLHDENHYTTAQDVALYFSEAMKHELFRTITATESYTLPATNILAARSFNNTNALLTEGHYPGYVYAPCFGGKTGTTDEAGHCLVAIAQKEDITLLSVVMGAENTWEGGALQRKQFSESTKLLEWGFNSFALYTLVSPGQQLASLPVKWSAETKTMGVVAKEGITLLLPNTTDLNAITPHVALGEEPLAAPVEAGAVVGSVTYKDIDGNEYGTVALITAAGAERSTLVFVLSHLHDFFFGPVGVVLLVVVLALAGRIVYVQVRRSRRRYRRAPKKRRR